MPTIFNCFIVPYEIGGRVENRIEYERIKRSYCFQNVGDYAR